MIITSSNNHKPTAVRDELLRELRIWVQKHGITEEGPYFLRYHVIDMNNRMDIEVGYVVSKHLDGEGRVTPGILPAGNYASLTYTRYGLRGNKALLNWAKANVYDGIVGTILPAMLFAADMKPT